MMENILGENACKHEGNWYPDGTEMCPGQEEEDCMVCRNGEWKGRMTGFYPAAG